MILVCPLHISEPYWLPDDDEEVIEEKEQEFGVLHVVIYCVLIVKSKRRDVQCNMWLFLLLLFGYFLALLSLLYIDQLFYANAITIVYFLDTIYIYTDTFILHIAILQYLQS